ncbi:MULTISPECIES: hypothetical protein [Acinetobacter]|uniref:Uncharacterized protein n=1 Tax=Acinetobacter corruptisaponis TaxID=3045147 RepID=A0ABY8S266_9GAMM|nr:hypothetical protein [Acinetobacter sp. KCTC 92772]WHP05792.1 hypothetical protein QLH32_17590 [Acinetobacter sp. KCTC 92772]
MQGNTTGLEILEEIEKAVETRIGNFTIMPVPMRNFKRFTTLVAPLYEDLMAVFDGQGDIVKIIEQHEPALVELLSLCSEFNQDHYNDDKFYPDDFSALILGLVEVNMDFFVQNLLPKITQQGNGLVGKLKQMMGKIGQTQSSALLATDTTSKVS